MLWGQDRNFNMRRVSVIVYLICSSFLRFLIPFGHASTYDDELRLHKSLLTDYNKHIRPRSCKDQVTNIHTKSFLMSLEGLDERQGILTTSCILVAIWMDNKLTWNPVNYGNFTDIPVEKDFIWSPHFAILNHANNVEKLGMTVDITRVFSNGLVYLKFGNVIQTTCEIDVTYFPFDIQNCALEFIQLGYGKKEIKISSKPINTSFYLETTLGFWNRHHLKQNALVHNLMWSIC